MMARILFDLAPSMAGYLEAVDYVLTLAASLGLYVELVVFADAALSGKDAETYGPGVMPDHGARAQWLEQLATRYRDDPRILWQVANEARKNGWNEADDPTLLDLADRLAGILGHRDFSISDPLDGDSEQATADMLRRFEAIGRRSNILVLHGSRKEEAGRLRPIEHLKGFRDVVDVTSGKVGRALYGIHDEWIGAAAQRESERRDNRPAVFVGGAVTCAILGLGFTYHYIAPQSDATPGLDEAAVALGIPAGPEFRYTNANLDGSWIGVFSGYEKIRPGHDDREAWAVGVGFDRGAVEIRDDWHVAKVLDMDSDGAIVTVWRGTR